MMNWRTATVLLGLSSLLACAKATYDGEDPFQAAGGAPADNGGAPSDEGGAPAGAGAPATAGATTGGAGAPAHAGAASTAGAPGHAGAAATGGRAGNTAGAPGTAGKGGGGSPGTAGAAAGGSGGAAVGTCDTPTEITATGTNGNSGSIGAAAACFSTSAKFTHLGCSNFDGRTLTVNGAPFTCAAMATALSPTQIDGFTYFAVSAGGLAYASFFFY